MLQPDAQWGESSNVLGTYEIFDPGGSCYNRIPEEDQALVFWNIMKSSIREVHATTRCPSGKKLTRPGT